MNDPFESDDPGDLASCWPDTPPAEQLKAALLRETSRVVRRRARLRRLRRLATVAVAYAAGIATAIVAWRRFELPPVIQVAQVPAPRAARQHDLSSTLLANQGREVSDERSGQLDERQLASLSPAELRRLVPDAPREQQIRLLEMAGDRYLYGRADVASALDCYRQVLELTPPEARREAQPNDSWLLAELKTAPAE